MNALTVANFDYSAVEPSLATKMQDIEARVRSRNRNVMIAMAETGRDLLSVRDQIERGQFLVWVEDRCGLRKSTAYRAMDVAQRLANELPTVGSLPPTVVYQLAAPTTPDPVRQGIMNRLKSGEDIPPDRIIEDIRTGREAERKAKEDAKLTPEERKQREQKERRQRKSKEQHAAEQAKDRAEDDARRKHEADEARDAARILVEALPAKTFRYFVQTLRDSTSRPEQSCDDFLNFVSEAAGFEAFHYWRSLDRVKDFEPLKPLKETLTGTQLIERRTIQARQIIVGFMKEMEPADQLEFLSYMRLQIDDLESRKTGRRLPPAPARSQLPESVIPPDEAVLDEVYSICISVLPRCDVQRKRDFFTRLRATVDALEQTAMSGDEEGNEQGRTRP